MFFNKRDCSIIGDRAISFFCILNFYKMLFFDEIHPLKTLKTLISEMFSNLISFS